MVQIRHEGGAAATLILVAIGVSTFALLGFIEVTIQNRLCPFAFP
jgi:hypothetical protein